MFNRLSIRTKLLAIVAAPLVVLLVLAGLGFTQRRAEAATTSDDAGRLELINDTRALRRSLQLEKLHSVTWISSEGERGGRELEAQQTRTDAAVKVLERSIADLDQSTSAVSSGAAAMRQLNLLDEVLRPQVRARSLAWSAAEQLYTQLEGLVVPIAERLIVDIDDADLAAGARSVVALSGYGSSQARLGALLEGAIADGRFDAQADAGPEEVSGARGLRALFDEAVDSSEVELTIASAQSGANIRSQLRTKMTGGDVAFFADQVDLVTDSEPDARLGIDGSRWSGAVQATLSQLGEITGEQADAVLDQATSQLDSAERASRLFLIGALLAVLVALALAVLVAASIARPVASLTKAADRVATVALPRMVESLRSPGHATEDRQPSIEHLDVGGGRELSQLSASVNSIQEVAVQVATEQSALLRKGIGDMFVNLARRNQALLDRQLEFIDELEAEEEDPDQLEHLFKLDHMATRMRRNAESLLVLAGAEPARRRGQPVPLTKVALAAVGEIEHFTRVELLDMDESQVASKAAADIAHLLSELMENATQFSPPETRVEVVGNRLETGGYTISVSDRGIGMSSAQLTEANELLARPPLLGLSLARTLGFIVVARLAARHGITVRLLPSPTGGVTALVTLPSAVLVGEPPDVDLRSASDEARSSVDPAGARSLADDVEQTVPPSRSFEGEVAEPAEVWAQTSELVPEAVGSVAASTSVGSEPLPDGLVGPVARAPQFRPPPAPPVPGPPQGDPSPTSASPAVPPAEVTAAGLVKRVPRRAGAARAMPGSDGGARGATTTARSPEEVRSMLSSFRAGKAAGLAPTDESAPPSDAPTPEPEDH